MKEESLKAHADAVLAADGALYDAGFADGEVAGKAAGGGFAQADLDKAVADAKAADVAEMQPKIDAALAQVEDLKAKYKVASDELAAIEAVLHPAPAAPAAPADQGTQGTDAQP